MSVELWCGASVMLGAGCLSRHTHAARWLTPTHTFHSVITLPREWTSEFWSHSTESMSFTRCCFQRVHSRRRDWYSRYFLWWVWQSIAINVCVFLSVCLLAYLRNHMSKLHTIFCIMLPVFMAQFYTGVIVIADVLPVLRMTSFSVGLLSWSNLHLER